jgi:hypothetical protein
MSRSSTATPSSATARCRSPNSTVTNSSHAVSPPPRRDWNARSGRSRASSARCLSMSAGPCHVRPSDRRPGELGWRMDPGPVMATVKEHSRRDGASCSSARTRTPSTRARLSEWRPTPRSPLRPRPAQAKLRTPSHPRAGKFDREADSLSYTDTKLSGDAQQVRYETRGSRPASIPRRTASNLVEDRILFLGESGGSP